MSSGETTEQQGIVTVGPRNDDDDDDDDEIALIRRAPEISSAAFLPTSTTGGSWRFVSVDTLMELGTFFA